MLGVAQPDREEIGQQMRERGTGLFGSAEAIRETIDRGAYPSSFTA
jgi:hypothetical protein